VGPIAALPAAVFLSIVVGVLGNFWLFVYFLGVLVYVCPVLRFCVLFIFFWFYPYGSSNILRVLFCVLVLFIVCRYI